MGLLTGISNWLRARGERGASGIEYGLVLALMVVGSTTSFEMMDERIEDHYNETSKDVGQADLDYFNVTTTTCAGCSTTSTTTTTTTAAPTTTTTTVAPTTTAAPTTTVASGEATSVTNSNWSGYYNCCGWDIYGQLRFKDQNGYNLSYASVSYTVTTATGDTQNFTGTSSSRGKVIVDWYPFDSSDIFPATVTITSVTKNGESYIPNNSTVVWNN